MCGPPRRSCTPRTPRSGSRSPQCCRNSRSLEQSAAPRTKFPGCSAEAVRSGRSPAAFTSPYSRAVRCCTPARRGGRLETGRAQYQSTVIAAYRTSPIPCMRPSPMPTPSPRGLKPRMPRGWLRSDAPQMELGYVNYLALLSAESTYEQTLLPACKPGDPLRRHHRIVPGARRRLVESKGSGREMNCVRTALFVSVAAFGAGCAVGPRWHAPRRPLTPATRRRRYPRAAPRHQFMAERCSAWSAAAISF